MVQSHVPHPTVQISRGVLQTIDEPRCLPIAISGPASCPDPEPGQHRRSGADRTPPAVQGSAGLACLPATSSERSWPFAALPRSSLPKSAAQPNGETAAEQQQQTATAPFRGARIDRYRASKRQNTSSGRKKRKRPDVRVSATRTPPQAELTTHTHTHIHTHARIRSLRQ